MMELFNFCQVQFWFIESGCFFFFSATERGMFFYFILFKTIVFHHGWHKRGWKIYKMKWNQILHRTVFALWLKARDEFAFSELFLSCAESCMIHDSVSTPSLTAQTHPWLSNNLRVNWYKTCYLTKLHIFLVVHLFYSVPTQSTVFFIHWVEAKSTRAVNAQQIPLCSSLLSISFDMQFLL